MKTFTAILIDIKSRRSQCDPFFLLRRLAKGREFGHSEVSVDRRYEDPAFRALLLEQPSELRKFDEGSLLGCVLQDPAVLTHSPAPLHFMLMNHCIRYGEVAFFDIAERVTRLCPDGVARQFLLRSVERLIDLLADHETRSGDIVFGRAFSTDPMTSAKPVLVSHIQAFYGFGEAQNTASHQSLAG